MGNKAEGWGWREAVRGLWSLMLVPQDVEVTDEFAFLPQDGSNHPPLPRLVPAPEGAEDHPPCTQGSQGSVAVTALRPQGAEHLSCSLTALSSLSQLHGDTSWGWVDSPMALAQAPSLHPAPPSTSAQG